MNSGKMISVWGNNSSGKTTLASQLACQLADTNHEVILVLTDITAPDMKVILPYEKNTRSMGDIWSMPDCSIEAIYKACVVTESDNICLLGYRNGENVFTNPDYTKDNILDVFLKLRNLVDYVIVDCVSEFPYNVLTTVALEMSDKVIRLGEATPKAFSFFDSNLPLLLDSRYKVNQHIKVLSKVKSSQPKEAAIDHYGGIDAVLPYSEVIERKMMEGELLSLTNVRNSKDYNSGILKIIELLSIPELIRTKQKAKVAKSVENGSQKKKSKDNVKRLPKGVTQYD